MNTKISRIIYFQIASKYKLVSALVSSGELYFCYNIELIHTYIHFSTIILTYNDQKQIIYAAKFNN